MIDSTLTPVAATRASVQALRLFETRPYQSAVARALVEFGKVERRNCPLKANLMVSLVVALSLYRSLSIPDAFRMLVTLLGADLLDDRLTSIADDALLRAKARLGEQVLPSVFKAIAADVRVHPSFRGHRTYALDGVKFSVADTPENESAFGRWRSSNGAKTAFPQLLAVVLLATETKEVKAVQFEKCTGAERPACEAFLSLLEAGDLVLMDRGLHAVWLYLEFVKRCIHFVCRARTSYKVTILQRLGPGDYFVEIVGCGSAEAAKTGRARTKMRLRMLEYRVGRRERVRLFTTLTDPEKYPAREVAALYHERWECELAFDEIKTHLATPPSGAVQSTFRSRSPALVMQEAYGLFIAYNLIRATIAQAARQSNINARDISFVGAIHAIDRRAASIEQLHGLAREAAWLELLAEISSRKTRKRRQRQYPRVLRVKISRFPRKRSWHRQRKSQLVEKLKLVNTRARSQARR